MDSSSCYCSKSPRKVLLGGFTFLNCEEDKCDFEIPLCHCKNLPISIKFDKTSYYICKDRQCNFVIAICECNKFCNILVSKTNLHPGVIFWACRNQYQGLGCKTRFIPIEPALKKYFPEIYFHEFACNLWKYMKEDRFINLL